MSEVIKQSIGFDIRYELTSNTHGFRIIVCLYREIGSDKWLEFPEGGLPLQQMLMEKAGISDSDLSPETALRRSMISTYYLQTI
jgi:hypothetical protein